MSCSGWSLASRERQRPEVCSLHRSLTRSSSFGVELGAMLSRPSSTWSVTPTQLAAKACVPCRSKTHSPGARRGESVEGGMLSRPAGPRQEIPVEEGRESMAPNAVSKLDDADAPGSPTPVANAPGSPKNTGSMASVRGTRRIDQHEQRIRHFLVAVRGGTPYHAHTTLPIPLPEEIHP